MEDLAPVARRREGRRVRPGRLREDEDWIAALLSFHGYAHELETDLPTALRAFQARSGAPATGRLNHQTCRQLNRVACAHPDRALDVEEEVQRLGSSRFSAPRLSRDLAGLASPEPFVDLESAAAEHPFELVHARWSRRRLGYCFVGGTPPELGSAAWPAVRRAFVSWSQPAVVTLSERSDPRDAEIRVLWSAGPAADPASPDPFYGPGGYVAMGYYPHAQLAELAGDLHFDSGEAWRIAADGPSAGFDVETVALHEIGHCLGIGHSALRHSAMWRSYKRVQHELAPEDIAELSRIYARAAA